MRLVFFGSGAFGLPTLKRLAERHDIAAIVTQPDKPAGRGGKLSPTPIAEWASASASRIPLRKPAKVNEASLVSDLRSHNADAWVVIAFGQKLGKNLLKDVFAINLHASLLPRWRGAAPINAAILAGDSVTGNSVITLADKMDAGLILAQSRRDIDPLTTAGELHDELAADGPELVESVLEARRNGSIMERLQDEAHVTIAPKLSKSDSWVDFREPAEACRRRIHGLTPWPGIAVTFRDLPLKLTRAHVSGDNASGEPGEIVDEGSGLVCCGEGSVLQVLEVHPAGRKNMAWPDFARGHRVQPGERFIGKRGQA